MDARLKTEEMKVMYSGSNWDYDSEDEGTQLAGTGEACSGIRERNVSLSEFISVGLFSTEPEQIVQRHCFDEFYSIHVEVEWCVFQAELTGN